MIEFIFLVGLLWLLTRLRYFGSLFVTSVVLFPAMYFFLKFMIKKEPGVMDNKIIQIITPYWVNFIDTAIWVIPAAIGVVIALFLFFLFVVRPVLIRIQMVLFKMKKRLFVKEEEQIEHISFDLKRYVPNKSGFFFGLDKNKKPVYVEDKHLTTHVQVVGPSGTGKTVSTLFPLAVQALLKGYRVIFVDGKGDAKLKQMFMAFCNQHKINMYFFDPLQPDYSHTYNPLVSSTDANEITNMLAVGLNLNAPGEAKVYTDIQKKFLATLIHLFIETEHRFNFIDIIEYMNHHDARDKCHELITEEFYKQEMEAFLARLSKRERELVGLVTVIDQLFVSDEKISELVNTYEPDIVIRDILKGNNGYQGVLFSFSAGMKAMTNEALAKMVLADIANAVGERHASLSQNHDFVMIILDEFGQYTSEQFDKFISTARSANIGCILSHQTNAQLETWFSKDKIARVVRENTAIKVIFRQSEEAEFWANCFGTKPALKRTEQVETGPLLTERVSEMGTLREVDEYLIHPNVLRKLKIGQAVLKFREQEPQVLNLGVYLVPDGISSYSKIPRVRKTTELGLFLREKRLNALKEKKQQDNRKGNEVVTSKKEYY